VLQRPRRHGLFLISLTFPREPVVGLPVNSMIGACSPLVRGTYSTAHQLVLFHTRSAACPQDWDGWWNWTDRLYEGAIGPGAVRKSDSILVSNCCIGLLPFYD
jgi:hypothetical protein